MRGAIPPPTHTYSWRGAQSGTRYVFNSVVLSEAQGQLYLTFMEPEEPLPCSQEPAPAPHPQRDESSKHVF